MQGNIYSLFNGKANGFREYIKESEKMAVRNKKIIEDALKPEDYVYGKGVPQTNEDRWKNESQYAAYDVNDDYTQKAIDAAERGDFPGASLYERISNEKYKLGYGTKKAPTYMFNYNPSENKAKAEEIREKLSEYDKFDYDPQNDAAYKALTNVYHRNAKAASENALARAAAANGGRLSSNAIIAANLGYQDKMAGLEAEIPQLRQAAYNMYRDEKNDLRQLGYDYANAEAENYRRWVDDYNRLYTGTMDKLSNEYNLSKGLGYVTYNLGQMTGITPGVPWASEVNVATQNAIALSQNLGYVTGSLSALTGIPEGTPFETAKQYMDNMKFNIQSEMGEFSTPFIESYGIDIPGGKTLGAKQLDVTQQNNLLDYNIGLLANQPYDPYGDETPDDNPDGTKPSIEQMAAKINSDPTVTSENVESVVEQYASMYGLSEEDMIKLYNGLNV